MTDSKERLSPMKKMKAALIEPPSPSKSPKPPKITIITTPEPEKEHIEDNSLAKEKTPASIEDYSDHCNSDTRMEEIYFDEPSSRECLSGNPGEHSMHEEERKKCTAENWKAEIERRLVAGSKMVDHAYAEEDPFRAQAYGHGDGAM